MNNAYLTLNELKSIELEILSHIDQVCQDNDITYYIAYGTAIGAVRHQGFIPWDDDIDILLMRDQYEKLEKVMSEKENERYVFKSIKTDKGYSIPYAKVIDTHTSLVRENYRKCVELGAYVDVFALDYLPKTENQMRFQNKVCQRLTVLWEISQLKDCGGANVLTRVIQSIIRVIPPRKYAIIMNAVAKRYNSRAHSNKVNELHYYVIPSMASDFDEVYGFGKEILFEGRVFVGPKDIDKQLTRTYGNYMQYPPIEQQVPKHPNHVLLKKQLNNGRNAQ